MKKVLMYVAVLFFAGCNSQEEKNAEIRDERPVSKIHGNIYILDTISIVHWAASKPGKTHEGTFHLKEGSFIIGSNRLMGGHFTIDISSLKNTDLTEKDGKQKLEGHLKSPDFFNTEKYPTAKFEITSILPFAEGNIYDDDVKEMLMIHGNLTLMDSTKNISFPARVTIDSTSLMAKADFKIDRTRWGLNYKGPGNPQDWFISKEVTLKLDLSATRK